MAVVMPRMSLLDFPLIPLGLRRVTVQEVFFIPAALAAQCSHPYLIKSQRLEQIHVRER